MKSCFEVFRRGAAGFVMGVLFLAAGLGARGVAQMNLGSVNVGANATTLVTVPVTTAGVLGSVSVRMMGAEGLDFTNGGGGSCAVGTAYAAGTNCTVNVTFQPRLAGQRRGAVVLLDASGNMLGTEYVQGTGNGPQAMILTGAGVATGIPSESVDLIHYGLGVDANETIWQVIDGGAEYWKLSNGTYTGPQSPIIGGEIEGDGGETAFDGAGFVYFAVLGGSYGRLVPSAPGGGTNGSGYLLQPGCGDIGAFFPLSVATDGIGNGYVLAEDGEIGALSYSTGSCSTLNLPFGWTGTLGSTTATSLTVDPSGDLIASLSNIAGSTCTSICLFEETNQQGNVVDTQLSTQLSNPTSPVSDGIGNLFAVADADPQDPSNTARDVFLVTPWPGGPLQYRDFAVANNHTGPLVLDGNGNLFTDGGAYEFNLLNPSPVTFASTGMGQSSTNQVFTVVNTGNAALTISSVTYPADFPEATGVTGECAAGGTVAAGGFCTITVVFSPVTGLTNPSARLDRANSQTLSETVKVISNSLNGTATEQDIPVTGVETLPVPTIALSSSANPVASGGSVILTAQLTPAAGVATPTGMVTFLDGTTTLGTGSLSGGSASYTVTGFSDGTHSITAQYAGDAANGPATSAVLVQVVGLSTPVITWATPAPIAAGTPLSATQLDATASVPGSFVYSPAAGTVLSAGQQTLMTTFTPTDTTLYRSATASVTLTVTQPVPTITVTSSKNPSLSTDTVTLTVAVASGSGTPTGTVTLTNGANGQTLTGSLTSGSYAVTASFLTTGTNAITAVYSGDSNFASATSAVLSQVVESFSIAPASSGSSSATVSPGGTATYALTATPPTVGTALSFSVTGLPTGATATFSPATIAAGTATPTAVTLSVAVPSSSAASSAGGPLGPAALPVALGVLLLPFVARRRFGMNGRLRGVLLCVAASVAAAGLVACGGSGGGGGGGGSTPTPTPTSYTLTVTAASGSLSETTQLTLTVN